MKRTKQEKAITLVALIITIIILLILAVVTIAAISEDGDLISHANNAKAKYTEEAAKENTTIQNYLSKIPEESGNGEVNPVNENDLFITYKHENNDRIYIFSKTEDQLTELDKQIINTEFDGELEYNEWNKSVQGNITTYSENFFYSKDNSEYTIKIVFGMEQSVNKSYIDSLGDDGILSYLGNESEYMYSCAKDESGFMWRVDPIEDKEIYTEEFKTEIFSYPVTGFNHSFEDINAVKTVPIIPTTAKQISEMFYYCDNISEVNYAGTLDQYKQISGYDTISNNDDFIVHCTNGDYVVNN